jgi:hypothetical protein
MDCVDEAIATSFFADSTRNIQIREETRWHAWPEREDDKSNEIASGHCTSPGSIELWTSVGGFCLTLWFVVQRQIDTVLCRGVVEEPDEEENSAGNVDEGINSVGPMHQKWVFEEPALYVELMEDVEVLFEMNDLECVSASYIDCAFDHCDSAERATELVYLSEV